jgi:chromatin remodeling complex protein RSC6
MTAVSQMYNFTQMSQMRIALRGANHIIARMPTKKAPAKKAPAKKANAAFLKPVQPDEALAKIVGSKPLPRTDLTKKLWDYIKKNKLQDAKKKTQINADDALKAVFNGKKSVSMFEMTKLVSGHLEK